MISILYVDDDRSLLDIGKLFLERSGDFQVELRDSARQALDSLDSSPFDIIVSDYEMPGMNGLVFLQNVRARFGEIPFILFTGRGREEVVIQALNDGADYYLQKGGDPIPQFAELVHKITLAVQHRKVNKELRESERRYREVVETQSEFISRFTPDGTTVFVNEAYCRYFGKSREEIVGHRFFPDIPKEDKEIISRHFSSLDIDNQVGEIEHRIRMPDGSIRWHRWRDHAIFDETGRLVEYQSLGKDITDRKQSEEDLERSENLYRTIFENTGAATIIYGQDRVIIHANAEFARLSGYSRTELEGKKAWSEFIFKEDLILMDQYHHARGNDPDLAPQTYEFRFVDRNGSIRYCINHVSLIPGSPRRVASVVDITDRVIAGQEYRNIFENIQDIFYRTDTSENLILASPSGAKTLGYSSASEIYGKRIAETLYVNPEDRKKILEEIKKTGSVSNYEMLLKNKEGKPMTMIASSHEYYDTAGNFQGIEGILHDISDRKQMEEELRASENLYRAVFENTGAASIIIGPDTTILRANSGWEKLTGIPIADQENNLSWTIFIDKEDVKRMVQYHHMRRKDPSLAPTVYECRAINADKSVHYCIVHVDVIPGTGNSVASLVDITERIRFEDELQAANEELIATQEELKAQFEELKYNQEKTRESEEKYRSILDHMEDVYYRTDREGNTIFATPSASTVLGYKSNSDIYGKNIADALYFNPEDRKQFLISIEKTGSVLNYEVLLKKQDGTPITVITSSHKYYDHDGNYLGIEGIFRDISDRKQIKTLYQTIFESVGIPLIILEDDMTISQVNAEFINAIGYSRSEIEGVLKWPSLITEEDRERMMEYHVRRREDPDNAPGIYESRFIHKSGEIRDVSLMVTVIPGTQKSLISFRNISDLKETQIELKKTEEVMSQLMSQLPDYVIIHEGETIIYANDEGARLMGKTPKEIIGTSVLSFASPEYHELLKKNIALRYQGVDLKPYSIEITLPTGERRWLEVRSASLPEQKKNTTLAVLTDITDRKNAEEALKESESRYRTIIENMQDLIYQADLQGRLIMMSPAGIKLTGYSPEELIGHDIGTNFYSDPYERKKFLELLRKDGKVTDYPLTLVDKKGEIHYVTASSHYYTDNQGNIAGVEGILHDITDKKRAEDAVLLANRKLSLLTNITRHDINNQLAALMGYLSILNESLKDSPEYEYSQNAESIAERINAIIQFTEQYEDIGVKAPIWQLIRQVVDDASEQAPLGSVILMNDISEDIEAFADPLLIKIIYNLIDNAVKYGNTISTIRFFVDEQGGELVLICEDDGMGIGRDEKEKIFEKGYGRNTGLGLALCQEILSMTDIMITETGEYGSGARFEIRIPSNGWRK